VIENASQGILISGASYTDTNLTSGAAFFCVQEMEPAISSTPKACGVISRHPRRGRVTRSHRRRKAGCAGERISAGGRQGQPYSICHAAKKRPCPRAKRHPTAGGGGSLLASKVGSFLASAEAPALANSTARSSPTYPNPTMPTLAVRLEIL
jgi:hypothetical protein